MKRGMICSCFSHGELGTAGVRLQLSIPHQDAPTPASPSLEDLNLRFCPPNTGQKPTVQRDTIPPCPEKPFLTPKSSGAPPAHPAKPPSTTCSPSSPTKPRLVFRWLSISPSPLLILPPSPAHFPGPSPLLKPALAPRRLQINTPRS